MERLKKYFNSAVAVMLLLVTATVNVSCGDDDEEDKGGSQKVYVKTVKMSATVVCSGRTIIPALPAAMLVSLRRKQYSPVSRL